MINIFIKEETIRVSRGSFNEQIFGVLFINIDESWFFPEKNWDDFILIVLEWWSDAIINVIQDTEAEFLFMDGSFAFKSIPIKDNNKIINLIFFHKNIEVKNIIVNKFDFVIEVKKSINILLKNLYTIGYNKNEDCQSLEKKFKIISKKSKLI